MFALTCGGKIYEWGDNLQGDLALPTAIRNIASPIVSIALSNLTGGSPVGVQITTGSYASALLVRGQAYGWGENNLAQCGCGSPAKVVTTPTPIVQNGVVFSSIDAGGNLYNGHTLARDARGNAYCWGNSLEGECGLGSTGIVPTPTRVPGLPALSLALAGGAYSLFLDTNGTVWACGDNALGQVGNGTTVNQLTAVSVLSGIRLISAGAGHDLAAN
jgi:hypothetical protein